MSGGQNPKEMSSHTPHQDAQRIQRVKILGNPEWRHQYALRIIGPLGAKRQCFNTKEASPPVSVVSSENCEFQVLLSQNRFCPGGIGGEKKVKKSVTHEPRKDGLQAKNKFSRMSESGKTLKVSFGITNKLRDYLGLPRILGYENCPTCVVLHKLGPLLDVWLS